MAIIYNLTIQVEKSVASQWLQWLTTEHIPQILATGCFSGYRLVRLLEVDETEGLTYAVQYEAQSKADYNRYIELHANAMRQLAYDKWGQRFIAFGSVMEVVHQV